MAFSTLGLSDALLRAVADQGYTVPTPIQRRAIPAVLAGGDLLAGAQTGTGKTAGFVLPMLQRLSTHPSPHAAGHRKPVRALILTPTRELAAQVEASIKTYGRHLSLTSMALFGGVGLGPQTAQLKRGVDILVATPGRLLDHQGQRNVDLSRVEIFVLDEADRMLDMGFIPDVKRVLALLPQRRQNLLFSATFSTEIKALAAKLLDRPQTIEVTPPNSTVDVIAQRVHPVGRNDKARLLAYLVGHHRWRQVLVFTRTKHGADKLVKSLHGDGIGAVALHGNKSQNARTRALADFKAGGVEVLVATDIAARGIDIDQLPHVVNYDLPNVPHDYVHRIGRTGRAGADGEAISLVCVDEQPFLRDIERLIKRSIPREVIPGFEPDPNEVAQPVFAQRGRGQMPGPRPAQTAARRPRRTRVRGPSTSVRIPERLAPLVEEGLIDTVVRQLMSGKEATVYLVRCGDEQRCAKVYKDANKRNFRQASLYQEGRKTKNSRQARAMQKGTRYGRQAQEEAWQTVEVDTLFRLAAAGVRVPRPYGLFEGVVLMELLTDAHGDPAPRLNDLVLPEEQALAYHSMLIRQIVRMLCAGVIHGDLSEFNVLVDRDGPVIIDLPQAVTASGNNNAAAMLQRDACNITTYFSRFAPALASTQYGKEIWSLYERGALHENVELTGQVAEDTRIADVAGVLHEIDDVRAEHEARLRYKAQLAH